MSSSSSCASLMGEGTCGDEETKRVFHFRTDRRRPSVTANSNREYFKTDLTEADNVLIVDNGSYNLRLGWTRLPDPLVTFKPLLAKTRREKGKDAELLVGDDLYSVDAAVKLNLRTPFDRNVVTQMESMEIVLDYGLAGLGLNDVPDSVDRAGVDHPVVITEPPANPAVSRGLMSELLFEGYSVPSVCYGVDALFSKFRNLGDACRTALVISLGFHTVHILPYIDGSLSSKGVRRINVGGFNLAIYLQRALQLKHPSHVSAITVPRTEEMLFDHCHVAEEYQEELAKWFDKTYFGRHVRKLQLPFVPVARPPPVDQEALKQRRQELAKRLVAINQRKREQKIQEDESLLKSLRACVLLLEQGYEDKVRRILDKHGFGDRARDDPSALDSLVQEVSERIERARTKMQPRTAAEDENDGDDASEDAAVVDSSSSCPPEKRRKRRSREEMDEREREHFDRWVQELKQKSRWQQSRQYRRFRDQSSQKFQY